MKNVTITLDEKIAARVRVEAAIQDKSVSKFISDLLTREIGRGGKTQLEAIEEFLSGPRLPLSDEKGRLPTREELYREREDELFRRYERSRVVDRPRAASQRESLKRFLNAPDFPGIAADLPSREELYAERLFHRHERAALHQGSADPVQARKGTRVARRPRK